MDKNQMLIAYDIFNIEEPEQTKVSRYLQGAWFQVDEE